MRRAGRIIYNGAAVVSLLLWLGTVGVWGRSYWVSDHFSWLDWPPDDTYLQCDDVIAARGGVQFISIHHHGYFWNRGSAPRFIYLAEPSKRYPLRSDPRGSGLYRGDESYNALGFEWAPDSMTAPHAAPQQPLSVRSLTFPLYFPCILFGLLPAHYVLRVRRRRRVASRRARGCCIFCGYDLRASPGRCPECGREAA